MVRKYIDNEVVDNTKKRVTFKVFDNEKAAKAYAKFNVEELTVTSNHLLSWFKGCKNLTNKSTSYIYSGVSLGSFGVNKKIFDMYETYYVVFNVSVG